MACGGCRKRRANMKATRQASAEKQLLGGYANLTHQQIKARLEVYKRRYCKDCEVRYECDYPKYVACKKNK